MVRLTESERETITLYDGYVITLFDKGLSSLEKLNKKQWKDLRNAGYMIDRLYTLSLAGNEDAKTILHSFVVRIAEQTEVFDTLVADIRKVYPIAEQEIKEQGVVCTLYWNNKMYLSLTNLLQKVDTISLELKALKKQQAIPSKVFRDYQHNVTGRFRNIMDFIYTSCKQHNKMMYPAKQATEETT